MTHAKRNSLRIGMFAISLVASTTGVLADRDRPIVTLTNAQETKLKAVYFNCDHEGSFGCLRLSCLSRKATREDAAEIQYLYRDVTETFPEFLTPKLRACFVRSGGRFQ